ncbi:unnamed protein product [Notodromas monacha]|uniref:Uncharacterized protein n=1 Tax=Notodromas monacha TaxID=399045 RepID=A0A7R9GIG9_9CRUS|nr:unnamed protein product [Notodromas monacha]CAG0922443.1 unnamed protein product [Notodromas monacha]
MDVIEKAAAAREGRAQERLRSTSAILLQSAVRGWLTRCRLGREARTDLLRAVTSNSVAPVEVHRALLTFLACRRCRLEKQTTAGNWKRPYENGEGDKALTLAVCKYDPDLC